MVVLEPNTRFDAWLGAVGWDQSRFYEHAQLVLQPGDAVFFLGSAVHAGAAFAEENMRLHCYVETEELHQRRLPDRRSLWTFFANAPRCETAILK